MERHDHARSRGSSETNGDTYPEGQRFGDALRAARERADVSISDVARELDSLKKRTWLSKVEHGRRVRPLHRWELEKCASLIGGDTPLLEDLRAQAEAAWEASRANAPASRTKTTVDIVRGEREVMDAIVGVIESQGSRAVLRNCGIKTERTYKVTNTTWTPYRDALGAFLERHPNAHMRRAEYLTSSGQLELAKAADMRLAGARPLEEVHNAHVRFHMTNPLALHVLIGEREVVLALPELSDQGGSSMAFVFRDPHVVDRFTEWFDVVVWDPHSPDSYSDVGAKDGFKHFDAEFDSVADLYEFDRPRPASELG